MAKSIINPPTADEYMARADDVSSRLYRLQNVAYLAAFAAAARRVLEGIEDVVAQLPELKKTISNHVEALNSLGEMKDVGPEVVEWVAQEMERLNVEMTEAMYAMAHDKALPGKLPA